MVFKVSGALCIVLLVIVMSNANISEASLDDMPLISVSNDTIFESKIASDGNPRIAVVKPIFTATAYANAFYPFYSKYRSSDEAYITTDLEYLNVTITDGWKWSAGLANFMNSLNAWTAGLWLDFTVELIDEIDVTMGALFVEDQRIYDVVILGFTEYVTQEEYNYFKRFVETGGTLIIMDACNFLAEVKYYPPTSSDTLGSLSLVKGHGWAFNGTHAWKSVYHRWPEENRNWVGSNFWKYWSGDHYDYFQANTSHQISTHIRNNYQSLVPTAYGAHEENKLENLTDTEIIGYWHFINSTEEPEDPIAAYEHKYGRGSVFHSGIMASDVIDREEFIQAFLVGAVRMGLTGDVGDWKFGEDTSYQSTVDILDKNGGPVGQDGVISESVFFHVNFSAIIFAENLSLYMLESVHLQIIRTRLLGFSEPLIIRGSKLGEPALIWYIEVNTENLDDGVYSFEIHDAFASISNESDSIDSTLWKATYEVKNIPHEIRTNLYLSTGSCLVGVGLVCTYIINRGRHE